MKRVDVREKRRMHKGQASIFGLEESMRRYYDTQREDRLTLGCVLASIWTEL